jgi:hypothetical protein
MEQREIDLEKHLEELHLKGKRTAALEHLLKSFITPEAPEPS